MCGMDSPFPFPPLPSGAEPPLDDRTRQIIWAAYALLDDEGLEGLTIRAVLARTGLARRAFYERFAGKDDLVLAVFAYAISMAAAHYREQVAALADPMERLRIVITSIARGRGSLDGEDSEQSNRRGAALSREHLRLAEARPIELQAALSPLLDLIATMLSDGMAAGVVRQAAPPRLATLVYNLVSTTVHAEFLAQEGTHIDRAHREALADDIWAFCGRAIAA
jgi:AcrR family transcriptional regulator